MHVEQDSSESRTGFASPQTGGPIICLRASGDAHRMDRDDHQLLSAFRALAAATQDRLAVLSSLTPITLIASSPGFDAWMDQDGVNLHELAIKVVDTRNHGQILHFLDGWRIDAHTAREDPSLVVLRVTPAEPPGNEIALAIDRVSGVPARASLDQELDRWFGRAERAPFAVVFVDINAFKAVNDDHGHLAGDDCLRQIATQLTHLVRESDFVGRYGGDEFVALLAGVNTMDELNPLVDRLREAVGAEFGSDSEGHRVAASFGAAISAEGFATARDLLVAADQRMYAEKRRLRST